MKCMIMLLNFTKITNHETYALKKLFIELSFGRFLHCMHIYYYIIVTVAPKEI